MKYFSDVLKKIKIWDKVLKGFIPLFLCVVAVATLPEQNKNTLFFIEKTTEKEKEADKSEKEEYTDEEEISQNQTIKKSKFKKKLVYHCLDSFLSTPNYTFTLSYLYAQTENNIASLPQGKACPFYILCHQMVFYEG